MQIVTQDLYTDLRVAVELLLRLSKHSRLDSPPSFEILYDSLSPDVVYGVPGSTLGIAFGIISDGDPYDLSPFSLSPVQVWRPLPTPVSYGPRRVFYPQLASMRDDAMCLAPDPTLMRGRNLADDFVELVERVALERLRG